MVNLIYTISIYTTNHVENVYINMDVKQTIPDVNIYALLKDINKDL